MSITSTISGAGLPPGGSAGQALVKNSNTSYDVTWASTTPTGNPGILAYFNASGNLDAAPNWSVDPDNFNISNIWSIGGADSRSVYAQLRMQTNLGGTITGTASSLDLTLSGGGTTNSVVLLNAGTAVDTTGDSYVASFSQNGGVTVGGNAVNVAISSGSVITGNLASVSANASNTVGGNYGGYGLNDSTDTAGSKVLLSLSSSGSAGTGMIGLDVFNTTVITGDLILSRLNNNADITNNFNGYSTYNQGVITKNWTGFSANLNADVGDGTGVNAQGMILDTSTGKTIDGGFFGVNIINRSTVTNQVTGFAISNEGDYSSLEGLRVNNSGTMTANNTMFGLNVTQNGPGYRFTGAFIQNNANQSEEIRGLQFNTTGDARTSTGIDINMQGNATDDAQAIRVNVSNQTSTNQRVTSISTQGGTVGFQSNWVPPSGANVDIGNGMSVTVEVPNGTPITGTDIIQTLIQSNLLLHDTIAPGPFGLGVNAVGAVSQIGFDSGIVQPIYRSMLVGTTVPSGSGGTLTDFVVMELIGLASFGGSITNVTRVGIQDSQLGGSNFSDNATETWFIRVRDPGCENHLPKLAISTSSMKVSTNVKLEVDGGHVKVTQTTPPVAVADANAGTGATASVTTATDMAGHISLTTGTLLWAAGAQVQITFDKAFNTAPILQLTATNSDAAIAIINTYVTKSTTTFEVNFVNPDVAATTYEWDYQILETA